MALCLATTLAAVPALGGTWVYDDLHMLNNATSDEPSDILSIFNRNSSDYLITSDTRDVSQGATYRPLTHLTLLLVHAGVGPLAWLHHLVSLLLHLMLVGFLAAVDRRRNQGSTWVGLFACAAVALHPAVGEAWLWINGRSDLVAAVFVAIAAWAAASPARRENAPTAAIALCTTVAATLSKEPALAAVGMVWGVWAVQPLLAAASSRRAAGAAPTEHRPWPWRQTATRVIIAVGAAMVSLGVYSLLLVRTMGGDAGAAAPVDVATLVARLPMLLALAGESLLVPLPRPMQLLAWSFHEGWTVGRMVLLGTLGATVVWMVARRQWAFLLYAVGAVVCLLPTGFVASHNWLGFDRYLVLPLLLLAIASIGAVPVSSVADVADVPGDAVGVRPPAAAGRDRALFAWAALVVILSTSLFFQARHYRSHHSFVSSLVTYNPDNGVGHVLYAQLFVRQGRHDMALEYLRVWEAARVPQPVAVLHAAASEFLKLGDTDAATRMVEAEFAKEPNNPLVLLDVLALRAGQGRWDETLPLLARLLESPLTCASARQLAASWYQEPRLSPPVRDALATQLAAAPCQPAP